MNSLSDCKISKAKAHRVQLPEQTRTLLRIALTTAREGPHRVSDLIYDMAVQDTTYLRVNLFISSMFQI